MDETFTVLKIPEGKISSAIFDQLFTLSKYSVLVTELRCISVNITYLYTSNRL